MFSRVVIKYTKKINFVPIRTFKHCFTCKTKTNCENLKRCELNDDDCGMIETIHMLNITNNITNNTSKNILKDFICDFVDSSDDS